MLFTKPSARLYHNRRLTCVQRLVSLQVDSDLVSIILPTVQMEETKNIHRSYTATVTFLL